jgi:3-oxoadipate enol-lactonase
MTAVFANGVSLHFEVRGEGPALLMLPGLGLDLGIFDAPARSLERRFSCIALDNRGAGESDAPRGPYRIEDLAVDAIAVLEAAGHERAFVLGHSLGGFVALELALLFPKAVSGLLLLSTAVAGDPAKLGRSEEAKAALSRRQGTKEQIERGILTACLTKEFLQERRDDFEMFVAGRLAHAPTGRGLSGQRAAAQAFDATARLRDLCVPAAVAHGDADRVVSLDCGRALAASIPNAALHVMRGVGHMPFLEAPSQLVAIADAAFVEGARR